MSAFGWLLLGHMVGDWLLQSDWMALGKQNSLFSLPGFAHYTVYTASVLPFSLPSFPVGPKTSTLLQISLIIFISHWLIDGTGLSQRWMQRFGQRDQTFMRIVIDQTFHLLVLGAVAAFLL